VLPFDILDDFMPQPPRFAFLPLPAQEQDFPPLLPLDFRYDAEHHHQEQQSDSVSDELTRVWDESAPAQQFAPASEAPFELSFVPSYGYGEDSFAEMFQPALSNFAGNVFARPFEDPC
jgi:hypothetical protein